jgi:hypothetical protein
MGYVAKLTKGARTLDLSSGRYSLGRDFVPPSTPITPYMAGGTSANRYGGSAKVDERAANIGMSLSVRIIGASNAEVERAVQDISWFLRQAGDPSEPVYFEWRPDNNVAFEPLWGQFGANKRLQVENGTVGHWAAYGSAGLNDIAAIAPIYLECRPFAQGKRQRLANATGHITESIIGMPMGVSRGVKTALTQTNLFNNPVFGHATYDNDWSVGASASKTKNTNLNYVLFGTASAYICTDADDIVGTTSHSIYESISLTASTTYCVSFYAKRPDGAAVTSDTVVVYLGGAKASTYVAIGNGWYRVYASADSGGGGATSCGAQVLQPAYLDGFQIQTTSIPTPLVCGDFIGCAWAGTAHDSDSTSTTGYIRLPTTLETINPGEGTIRVVWVPDVTSGHGNDLYLFEHTTAGDLACYYDVSETKFVFDIGSANINSSVSTFSRGTKIVLHLVWKESGTTGVCKIYRDGVSIGQSGAGAIELPEGIGTGYLYIGTQETGTLPGWGAFSGFSIFDRAMSATEVANDYANVYQVIADDQQLEPIPYFWTDEGDGVLENGDDGTSENWGICAGIPGTAPADTLIKMTGGAEADIPDGYLSLLDMQYDLFEKPDFLTDNGSPDTISIDTSATSITTITLTDRQNRILNGRELGSVILGRVPTTNNLSLRTCITAGSGYYNSAYRVASFVTHGSNVSKDISPFIAMPQKDRIYNEITSTLSSTVKIEGKRASGGAENFYMTSMQLIPRPTVRWDVGSSAAYGLIYAHGQFYRAAATTYNLTSGQVDTQGDVIELRPGCYNALIGNFGTPAGAILSTYDVAVDIWITPRWVVT